MARHRMCSSFILFVCVCVCVCACVCVLGGRVRFFISASSEHYHADPEICNYTKLGKNKCCRHASYPASNIFKTKTN